MSIKCWEDVGTVPIDRAHPNMLKAPFLIVLVALATCTFSARIARSPGGAGWQGSSGRGFSGYSDNEPSIVAARSGGSWGSGNFGRSFGGSSSGWGSSGANARSSGSGWGRGSNSYDGFAARNYDDYDSGHKHNAFSSRSNSLGGYSDHSGNHGGFASRSAGYEGYTGNSGGYPAGVGGYSSDYTDASGRSVSWQASW